MTPQDPFHWFVLVLGLFTLITLAAIAIVKRRKKVAIKDDSPETTTVPPPQPNPTPMIIGNVRRAKAPTDGKSDTDPISPTETITFDRIR